MSGPIPKPPGRRQRRNRGRLSLVVPGEVETQAAAKGGAARGATGPAGTAQAHPPAVVGLLAVGTRPGGPVRHGHAGRSQAVHAL